MSTVRVPAAYEHTCKLMRSVGEGFFFKTHADTPLGPNMFGALVLVFQNRRNGGDLIFRCEGFEDNFQLAVTVELASEPSIAYAALYSEVEHEVVRVKSGERVGLTFNLYFGEMQTYGCDVAVPRGAAIMGKEAAFRAAADARVAKHEIFQDSLALAFPLHHMYAIEVQRDGNPRESISHVPALLKGSDSTLFTVVRALGLEPTVGSISAELDASSRAD
jgi:hypothetical protein